VVAKGARGSGLVWSLSCGQANTERLPAPPASMLRQSLTSSHQTPIVVIAEASTAVLWQSRFQMMAVTFRPQAYADQ